MYRNIYKISITVIWILAMFALVDRRYQILPLQPATQLLSEKSMLGEKWAGIYRKGEKIGYTMSKVSKDDSGFRAHDKSFMNVKVMGITKNISITTDAMLDSQFHIKSFELDMESDINMRISATREGKMLRVKVNAAGIGSEKLIPLTDDPLMSPFVFAFIGSRSLNVGDEIEVPLFDPTSLAQNVLTLSITSKETITVMGKGMETFRLNGNFMGVDMTAWITEEGELMREESAGLVYVRENKDDAVRLDQPSLDLVADLSIPFNLELPEGISYLKVRIEEIKLDGLDIEGGNQIQSGNVIEISNVKTPSESKYPDQFLKPSHFIESSDPEIMRVSGQITGDETSLDKKARLIYDWVYSNIVKMPTMSIPSATAVLKSKIGDCNEHTTLFTALARASGIPTKMAIGLVYQEGRFYYHAWPEIYLDGWLPVDPTLGQWPADASHIRLLSGNLDKQLRLLSVIGKIKLYGLSYK